MYLCDVVDPTADAEVSNWNRKRTSVDLAENEQVVIGQLIDPLQPICLLLAPLSKISDDAILILFAVEDKSRLSNCPKCTLSPSLLKATSNMNANFLSMRVLYSLSFGLGGLRRS